MLQVGHPGSSVIHPNSPFCTGLLPRVCSLHGRRQFLRALAKYELKTAKNGRGKQVGASADRPEVWANEGEKVPENAQLKAYLRCRIFTSTVGYGKVSHHQPSVLSPKDSWLVLQAWSSSQQRCFFTVSASFPSNSRSGASTPTASHPFEFARPKKLLADRSSHLCICVFLTVALFPPFLSLPPSNLPS